MKTLLRILLFCASIWATTAIYFDCRYPALCIPLAAIYFCLTFYTLFLRKGGISIAAAAGAFALVLMWWFSLKPSDNRQWQADADRTAWSEINGNIVTIHNVRNIDYRTETDYTPHWETRTYDLTKIRGIDIFLTHWGPPLIAHPIMSFEFADSIPIAFSIEVRDMIGQSYSAVRGFFRQFKLIYQVADERDVIRLRTNYRKDEEVTIYRTRAEQPRARAMFLDYLKTVNYLHEHPEWYNAATNNCTTGIRMHAVKTDKGTPPVWNWRILLNGNVDQLLWDRGDIAGDNIPIAEFRKLAHINSAARAADKSPDFSRLVRIGRPGF